MAHPIRPESYLAIDNFYKEWDIWTQFVNQYTNRALQLDSLEPDPDDTITIEANLAQTSTVKFALTNRFPSYATFQAYFSTESAYTLSVTPTNGLLAPAGSEGTQRRNFPEGDDHDAVNP